MLLPSIGFICVNRRSALSAEAAATESTGATALTHTLHLLFISLVLVCSEDALEEFLLLLHSLLHSFHIESARTAALLELLHHGFRLFEEVVINFLVLVIVGLAGLFDTICTHLGHVFSIELRLCESASCHHKGKKPKNYFFHTVTVELNVLPSLD